MKKKIFLFALLLTLVCAVAVLSVGAESAEPTPSEGLSFTSNGDGTCYVSGIGTCTDTVIIIPSISPAGDTVTGVGDYAFKNCTNLTGVEIPSGVTGIGTYAFYKCTSLASVTLPSSLTSIGANAFNRCVAMKSIDIPYGVTSIGSMAFYGCTGLTNVTVPSSVTSIGSSAFNGCSGMISVTIPLSVTEFGNYAFKSCSKLTIYCAAASQPSDWNPYWNPSNCPVVWDYVCEHTLIETAQVNATCTTDGCLAYWTCSKCGRIFADAAAATKVTDMSSLTISAPVHNIVKDTGYAATCTTDGLTDGEHCTECDYKVEQTVIKAAGHKFVTYAYNDEGHWLTCACGEKTAVEAHTAQDGKCVCGWTAPEEEEELTAEEYLRRTGFLAEDEEYNANATYTYGDLVYRIWRMNGCPTATKRTMYFNDVYESDYYYEAVLWGLEIKMLNTPAHRRMSPGTVMTRQTFITLLYAAEGKPVSEGDVHFTDTYYAASYIKALDWSWDAGILTTETEGTKFRPHSQLTTETAAAWLQSYQKYLNNK